MKSFGSKELIKCLKNLGFKQQPQVGSRHLKFSSPKKVEVGKRPFIIVLQGKKEFDPVTQKKIIKQIELLGYTKKDIEANV